MAPNLKSQVTNTTGARGGIAFLTREPSTVLDSPGYCFRSFECASITLKLPNTQLTIFNVYRPPKSSPYSSPPAVFLQEFTTLLSIAATTPHEFLITGDFNIHVLIYPRIFHPLIIYKPDPIRQLPHALPRPHT